MFGIFSKRERLVGIDIGAAAIKMVELELSGSTPSVVRADVVPLSGDVFANNAITKPDRVVAEIVRCFGAGVENRCRGVTAVPAPSVFIKRIQVPRSAGAELVANVQLEASNLVPHKLDAVKLDFQVLGTSGKETLDVLLVAVKRDVLESFTTCLSGAGIETAIVDVDLFALQNAYEFLNPERRAGTVAIINAGARYTSINICRDGRTLFSGDLPIGGRGCTEAIMQRQGIGFEDAEARKLACVGEGGDVLIRDVIGRWVDNAALEINRQLGFFWGAAAVEGRIDAVIVGGGVASTPGFVEAIATRTELPCERFDPFRGVRCGPAVNGRALAAHGAALGVAVGLALRQCGDKSTAEGRV